MTRIVLYSLLGALAIGGTAVTADALVETDEERLEALADELEEGGPAAVDGVLRWTDLAREPVTVRDDRRDRELEEGEDGALADAVTDALAPLGRGEVDVVQRSVEVRGDRGTIALRARVDGELIDANLRLSRSGQGWLVTSLRVR